MTLGVGPIAVAPVSDDESSIVAQSPAAGPRTYGAFLRCPGGFNFALADVFRNGVQYYGQMTVIPVPSDSLTDDFGIIVGGGFSVEIADEVTAGGVDGLGADWYILQADGSRILLADGSGSLIMGY